MEKKKILIISRSFYPMNSPRSFRTTELVKEFARVGHEVTLLTLKNDDLHRPFEKEHGVFIKDLGSLKLPKIQIPGQNRLAYLFNRGLKRGMNLLFEYPDIELMRKVKRAVKKEKNYDLLISIAVPHPIHWGVASARKKAQPVAKSWIADCGDPYMGNRLDTFRKPFYFKYLEKKFCNKADFISVPLEDAKKGYYPEFRNKIRVIPQGFNFNEVDINPAEYKPNRVPTFAYAGGLIPGGRDPRKFLDYLVNVEEEYKFILYTKSSGLVLPYMNESKGKIEIRDYIPRKKLLRVLSRMDFLVNFENRSELMMPSKLIDYYLTGRPVLSVSSSEVNPNTLNQFLNGNYESKYRFENMDRYRIENVCKRFLSLSNS